MCIRDSLVGYYGRRNTGDDTFLTVSAWGARRYLGCDEIYAVAGVLPNTHGIQVRPVHFTTQLSTYDRIREWWSYSRAGSIVFGGGSNFHTRAYMEGVSRKLELSRLARRSTVRAAVGVSIGPFRDARAETACAKLLNKLTFVGVRDRASYKRAMEIAPDARVELTFDLAPLLPVVTNVDVGEISRSSNSLGVAMCNYERFVGGRVQDEERRIRIVAESIRNNVGLVDEVVLFDFNGHEYFGDASVSNALAELLQGAIPVRHFRYEADPVSMLRGIAGLRGMIAMRMHAAVFAFCSRTPFVLLAYHEKCREFGNMIGFPSELTFDASHLEVDAITRGIELILDGNGPLSLLPVETATENALRNWSWVEELDSPDHFFLR